ncbi:hypothetical protein MRB53_032740 [Persea americana]|uniref:Uncharacterized protein n=1 Tax=Persea americana TaxID=3435 RepID=A0ACC2KSQ2_PERAE|nr:hypothetical protein MRB53_032740 [Persea americana]
MLFKLTFRENNLRFVSLRIQRNLQPTQCSGSSANIFFDEKGVASISFSSPPYPSRSSAHIFFDENGVASLSSSSPPILQDPLRASSSTKKESHLSLLLLPPILRYTEKKHHPKLPLRVRSSMKRGKHLLFDKKGENLLLCRLKSLEIAILKQNIYPHM